MIFLQRKFLFLISLTTLIPLSTLHADQGPRAMHRFSKNSNNSITKRVNKAQVKLYNVSFKRTAPNRGFWRGLIQGNGDITLHLKISNNGIKKSRYIGRVQQRITERPTPFKYTSAIPSSSNWSWKITATAK